MNVHTGRVLDGLPHYFKLLDVCVIDVRTLRVLPRTYTGTAAHFLSNGVHFANANDDWVASGAEQHMGVLWSRAYGCLLGRLVHTAMVSTVAFNPRRDAHMAVSVSDDRTLKVWTSRQRLDEQAAVVDGTITV